MHTNLIFKTVFYLKKKTKKKKRKIDNTLRLEFL